MKNYEKKHRNIERNIEDIEKENIYEKTRNEYNEIAKDMPAQPKLAEVEMM